MNKTIIIVGAVLLILVLLCALLIVGLLVIGANTDSDWMPRWDRDRTQWDSRLWEPMDGSRTCPSYRPLTAQLLA